MQGVEEYGDRRERDVHTLKLEGDAKRRIQKAIFENERERDKERERKRELVSEIQKERERERERERGCYFRA